MITFLKGKKRRIAQYAFLALLTFLILFVAGKMYQVLLISPDDIAMKSYISGLATGTPDGHCWFLQYPLSAFLAQLYCLFPQLEWYDLFFIGCIAVCIFLILQRVFHIKERKNKIVYLLIVVVSVALLFLEHIINLEWTATAGILGSTAIFRYVTMDQRQQRVFQILDRVLILGLLLLSFLIRNNVCYVSLSLLLACGVVKMIALKQDKMDWKKTLYLDGGLVLACIVLLVGCSAIHHAAYATPEWKAYQDFTKDRSTLFDYYGYPDYSTYQLYYENAGISYEMYELISQDYNFLIAFDEMEKVDISAIADLAKGINTSQRGMGECIHSAYQKIVTVMTDSAYLLPGMLALVLLCCCLFFLRGNSFAMLMGAGAIAWIVLMMLYLAFSGRLPVRVELCILFDGIAVMGGLLYNQAAAQPTISLRLDWARLTLCGLALLCVIFNGYRLYSDNISDSKNASAKADIGVYCQQHPNGIFLRDFWTLSQNADFFLHGTEFGSSNYIATGGWQYQMPTYQMSLERNECEDFTDAVLEGKEAYYLVAEYRAEDVIKRLNHYFISTRQRIVVYTTDWLETQQGTICVLRFMSY